MYTQLRPANGRVRHLIRVLSYQLPVSSILTYLPTSISVLYLDTYILRSLILGPPWGPKIAKGYLRRRAELTLAALGRPKPRFVRYFASQKQHQKNMIFQHRPKTSQNSLTINFRTPKGQI